MANETNETNQSNESDASDINPIEPGRDLPEGSTSGRKLPGGLVHSYQKYDPKNFPSPTAEAPDLASAAMNQMLMYGDMRELTEEELARAVRLDPSMFPKLGPSLDALRAMLEERKRKILATYETDSVQQQSAREFRELAREATPPGNMRKGFDEAVREEQIGDLEALYYKQKDDQSQFSQELVQLINTLGAKYEVEELASKYSFSGREGLDVEQALEVKNELETIDKLLEQLKQAKENAQLAIIDMESMQEMAENAGIDQEQINELNEIQRQIEDYLRNEAARQGLDKTSKGFRLSPKALRLFQKHLLTEIFSDLQAARSGRHTGTVTGEGVVEIEKTKPYEFGDSATNVDVVGSVLNAASRQAQSRARDAQASGHVGDSLRRELQASMDALQIHLTRNNPKCATMVLMDMSGSMRYDGQYIHCKRMALALDGLIRTEYPGDYVGFVEMYSVAKVRHVSEVPALLPKPVSIHAPRVRLKADMSNPRMSEMQLPQHFTNIQHALQLARQVLSGQDTPNRQIMLITDGLPTAHFEGKDLYFLYPPDPMTEEATMREAMLCKRAGITINIFLLPSWSQSSEDIQFAHRLAETTKGRVFFTGGRDLDRYVVWDYVKQRRSVIG
jgi:uncharacterized protein with von Willebrand factor type A (vWA) domain